MAVSASTRLTWSLCIPTFNRVDILKIAIACGLRQTRLPKEIIVIDASDNWEANRQEVQAVKGDHNIELIYLQATHKSSAQQRNQAITAATSDILFFTDDDSLMFETCAEELMSAFSRDSEGRIAGIGATHVTSLPELARSLLGMGGGEERNLNLSDSTCAVATKDSRLQRKHRKSSARELYESLNRRSSFFRFFRREVLMMSMDKMFVPYDDTSRRSKTSLAALDLSEDECRISRHLPGYAMAVRKEVAAKEKFNPHLLSYCPMEDLDASYRWGRHGACLILRSANVHHYTVASSRIKAKQVTALGICNVAFFLKCNSNKLGYHGAALMIWLVRRALGEFIKDLVTLSLKLPRTRGAIGTFPKCVRILLHEENSVATWYQKEQRNILSAF